MLTPKSIKAKTAIDYFKKGYYENGQWLGKGAAALGLKGEIKDPAAYENIIQGLSPNGKQKLFAREVASDKRRVAVDCTFAAPKSVSLSALPGGDERLVEAHTTAVQKVLLHMEAEYSLTRVMLDGKHQQVMKTGNLVIATYNHIETRELDPHLHTHALVMNMTQLSNGEWYSHLNEAIFRDQKLLGMMYQHYLAREVQKLGYEVEWRDHGQFEIKGYTEEERMEFSKRRQQILAKAGVDASWQEREKAWKKTRRSKELVSPEELKSKWREEAQELGIKFVKPGEPRPELEIPQVEPKIFEDALKHCSEKQVAFKAKDITKFVLSHSQQTVDAAQIQFLVDRSNELVRIEDKKHGVRYTTQTAIRLEEETIRLMRHGQRTFRSISHPEVIEHHLAPTNLNNGQRQAVTMTLTTNDQFVAWQGVAGAGKTYALSELKAFAEARGYVVKGFAPGAKAARVLGKETDSPTDTVARLLSTKPSGEIQPHQIWVVDEAGLLSAKDAHALLQKAISERARVILVGDTKQLSAVEAGNPFKSLQQAGIKTAYLNESLRQRNSPQLKLAVDLLAEGRVEEGFGRLLVNGSVQRITQSTKAATIVAAYLSMTPLERAKTLLLAGTHEERRTITKALRDGLKAEGSLGDDVKLIQLKAKNLSDAEKEYAGAFTVGDIVMPLRDYKRKQLIKGESYEVVRKTSDKLQLKASDGKQLEVKLDFKKAVFEREEIEIAVGERLMWKKNNKSLEQVNGEEVVVKSINGSLVEIENSSGKTCTINLSQPHHLDHAIVRTTYSSQGETADRVLIAADSTIGKESFYVAASRARHELCFYTENPQELLKWALQSRAQENPLELLRQQVRERMAKETATSSQQLSRSLVTSGNRTSSVAEPPVKHCRHSTPERPIKANVAGLAPLKKRPMPVEAFWAPGNAGEAPPHIEPKHWKELVEDSAIHPDIAARNFRSLQHDMVEQSHEAWEYLFYSDKLERSNTGRLTSGTLNRYAHIEAGGWWSSAGVDPRSFQGLQVGQKPEQKLWGSFKPNQPREDTEKPGKNIKYEHPLKTELSIFLLDVPDKIADRIYEQAKVNPCESDLANGFWYCVWKHNLPITITEGAKKAASLLSQGHAAIGLPGIYAGYRSKDEQGYQIKPHLHEELAVFATQSREIRFAFDYETKSKTQRNIEIAISRTGSLLENEGAKVSVVSLPGPHKGVDDLIKAQGPLAYEKLEREALRLKAWREKNKAQRSVLEFPGKSSVEERKAQLKAKFSNQHSTNLQPKSQEQTKDFNPGQLQSPDGTNSRDSSHASDSSTSSETRGPGVQNQQHGGKHDQFEVGPERLPAKIADYITQLQQPQRAQPELTDSPLESQSFQFPVLDESKWSAVRDYFVTQRGLSAALLDNLHNQGTIWADNKQNAVFLRIDKEGQVTGAELIYTSNLQDPFNELAVGSKQNESWFRFAQGDGRLTRVVLTDSPIDALSLATLEQAQQKTIYMSVDEVGNIPQEALQSFSDRGGGIEIAFDADATGVEMAQQVKKQLPGATQIQPKHGKDWNEQLLHYHQMWQHYSSESGGSNGTGREYEIGKLALRDGHSIKDIAQMLMRSPAVEQIANQLGADEARNHVGRTTDAVFEIEHQQERHQIRLRNDGLQL